MVATNVDVPALAASVGRAHERLQAWRTARPDALLWTPLMRSRTWLEAAGGGPVYVKLESEQATGSFKVRGALNAITVAAERAGANVVRIVTASTGYAGRPGTRPTPRRCLILY
jgi:threonine dehydratase